MTGGTWMRAAGAMASAGVAAGLAFLASVLVARTFGPDAFGLYAALLTLFSLVAPLALSGGGPLLLRHTARGEPVTAHRVLRGSAVAGTAGMALLAAILIAAGPALTGFPALVFVLASVLAVDTAIRDLTRSALQAQRRDGAVAGWRILTPALLLAGVTLAAVSGWSFTTYVAALAVLASGALALGGAVLRRFARDLRAQRPETAPAGRRALVRTGMPFALGGVLFGVYYRVDVLMLTVLMDTSAAGLYQTAALLLTAVYLLPDAVFQQYLQPRVHQWWTRGPPVRAARIGAAACAGLGAVAAVGLALAADPLVPALFGAAYADASPVLWILAAAAPFHLVAIALGAFLVTEAGVSARLRVQGVTAATNVALNALLIPWLGIAGAAVATVATEAVLVAGYARALVRRLRAGG